MKKILLVALLVTAVGIAYWLIAPAFIDTEVQDELDPEIAALLEAQSESITTTQDTNGAVTSGIAPAPGVMPQPVIRGPFNINDTPSHPASGQVRIIETPSDGNTVRFEAYRGTNGPDLFVYLATDLDATDFVSLGRAKGNQGNINYAVPDDIDLDDYQYVLTWCKAFGVLFDYAEIN